MNTKIKKEKVKEIVNDTGLAVVKGGIGSIPIAGPFLSELLGNFIERKSKQQLKKWMEALEFRIDSIQNQVMHNEDLFYSCLVKTTREILQVHQDEKIEYLANAVVNSYSSNLDEDKILIFLDLISKYTLTHVRVLDFFNNPSKHVQDNEIRSILMGSPMQIFYSVNPDYKENQSLISKIIVDLYDDGLLSGRDFNVSMTASGMMTKRSTYLGDEFLCFIYNKTILK